MIRLKLMFVLLVTLVAGCASSDDTGPTPTSPTAPTAPSSPAPPPSTSCKPPAPTGLTVTYGGGSQRTFRWNAIAGVIDYTIQIGTESGRYDLIDTNTSQPEYSWTGQGVIPGRLYYARVHARNSCGSGDPSVEISFQ